MGSKTLQRSSLELYYDLLVTSGYLYCRNVFFFLSFSVAMAQGLWDFSSPTAYRTQAVAAMMTILTTRLVGAPEAGIFSVLVLQMHHV